MKVTFGDRQTDRQVGLTSAVEALLACLTGGDGVAERLGQGIALDVRRECSDDGVGTIDGRAAQVPRVVGLGQGVAVSISRELPHRLAEVGRAGAQRVAHDPSVGVRLPAGGPIELALQVVAGQGVGDGGQPERDGEGSDGERDRDPGGQPEREPALVWNAHKLK